jgi:hypothetical protein
MIDAVNRVINNLYRTVYRAICNNVYDIWRVIPKVDRDFIINGGYVTFHYSYIFYRHLKKNVKYVKNSMKSVLGDLIIEEKFTCYKEKIYDSFKIYSYKIRKGDDEYFFDYLIRDSSQRTEFEILDKMLNDTYENITEKENNKHMILYLNFMLEDETILCDISDDINKLRYHFDCEDKNMVLYWKDIYEIVKDKYTNIENDGSINIHERLSYLNDINNIYIYMILNDNSLSEKVVLLSSMMDKIIYFN